MKHFRNGVRCWAVVALLVAVGCTVAAGAPVEGRGKDPQYVRACGTVTVGARSLAVDFAEGRGYAPTCAQARGVARRWLRVHHGFDLYGRHWSCYRSRAGGAGGWRYNCGTFTEKAYAVIGIGRNFGA